MNKEEFFERAINRICKDYDYNFATEFKLLYLEKDKQIEELQERIDKAIEYIWSTKYEWGDLEEDNEDFDIDIYKLLDILEGGNNEK